MLIVEIIQGIKSAKIRKPVPIELKTSLEIAVQIIAQHTAIGPIPHEYLPFLVIQIDIIGDIRFSQGQLFLDYRVATSLYVDLVGITHDRTDILIRLRGLGER